MPVRHLPERHSAIADRTDATKRELSEVAEIVLVIPRLLVQYKGAGVSVECKRPKQRSGCVRSGGECRVPATLFLE